MSSSVHADNKGKDILILDEEATQRLDEQKQNILLIPHNLVTSLHYNKSNRFLFVNATKIYQFKAKDSEIKDYASSLGNISKSFTIDNIIKKQD